MIFASVLYIIEWLFSSHNWKLFSIGDYETRDNTVQPYRYRKSIAYSKVLSHKWQSIFANVLVRRTFQIVSSIPVSKLPYQLVDGSRTVNLFSSANLRWTGFDRNHLFVLSDVDGNTSTTRARGTITVYIIRYVHSNRSQCPPDKARLSFYGATFGLPRSIWRMSSHVTWRKSIEGAVGGCCLL